MRSFETTRLPDEPSKVPSIERMLTPDSAEQFHTKSLEDQQGAAFKQAEAFLAHKAEDKYKTSDLSPMAEKHRRQLAPELDYPEVRNDYEIIQMKNHLADLRQRTIDGRDVRPQQAKVTPEVTEYYKRIMDPKRQEPLHLTPEQFKWIGERSPEDAAEIQRLREEIDKIPDTSIGKAA